MKNVLRFLSSTSGTLKARTIRGGIYITGATLLTYLFDLLTSIVLARILLPEIFGVMSIVLFVRGGIEVFTQTNFKSALIFKRGDIERSADTAWVLNALRGVVLAAFVVLASPLISRFYGEPLLGRALRFLALVFIVQGFSNINMVLFDKSLDFRKVAIARAGSLLYGVAVIALGWVLRSVWALLFGIALRSVYDFAVSFLIQKKRPRFAFDRKIALELFHYSKYVTGTGILVFLTTRGDDAVVGKLLNLTALGYYTYAYTIANLPATHLTRVVSEIIFPSYSAINDDPARMGKVFLTVHKFIGHVTIPFGVLLAVFSREIVVLVLGPKWEPAVAPLRVLIVFGVVRSLAATTGPLFKAVGRPDLMFRIVLVKLLVILALIIPLTRSFGLAGASLAVTVPMVAEQLYLWTILKRLVDASVGRIFRGLLAPVGCALFVGAVMTAWKSGFAVDRLSKLALVLAVAAVLYAGVAWIVDRKFLRGVLRA